MKQARIAVKRLTAAEAALLRDIIERRRPSLANVVASLGQVPLSEDQREELRLALADELTERGLQLDGEPSSYGLSVDDLIGRLTTY